MVQGQQIDAMHSATRGSFVEVNASFLLENEPINTYHTHHLKCLSQYIYSASMNNRYAFKACQLKKNGRHINI